MESKSHGSPRDYGVTGLWACLTPSPRAGASVTQGLAQVAAPAPGPAGVLET